jgi:hypothetical protein
VFPIELSPAELAIAQCEPHEPPCPPDSRCTVCYSADEISNAESFDAAYADDKREVEQPGYWVTWADQISDDVCVPREGPL